MVQRHRHGGVWDVVDGRVVCSRTFRGQAHLPHLHSTCHARLLPYTFHPTLTLPPTSHTALHPTVQRDKLKPPCFHTSFRGQWTPWMLAACTHACTHAASLPWQALTDRERRVLCGGCYCKGFTTCRRVEAMRWWDRGRGCKRTSWGWCCMLLLQPSWRVSPHATGGGGFEGSKTCAWCAMGGGTATMRW
jgi:hypothetical protein